MQSAPRRPVGRREVIAKHKLLIKETIRNFCAETSLETAMAQTVLELKYRNYYYYYYL
jgi:hypothetical protein